MLHTRLKAFLIHLCFSLLIALLALFIIFFLWYPGIFSDELGGFKLFFLVVGCDVVIGPLLTSVIFDKRKPTRELFIDCALIVIIQICVLAYGMHVVSASRPAYIVFIKDRLEVVTPIEFGKDSFENISEKAKEYRSFPLLGPEYVSIAFPEDQKLRSEMTLNSVFTGRDYSLYPNFYQPYEKAFDEIIEKTRALTTLNLSKENKLLLDESVKKAALPEEKIGWLLVKHRFGFCTALINLGTGFPVAYLPFDPDDAG